MPPSWPRLLALAGGGTAAAALPSAGLPLWAGIVGPLVVAVAGAPVLKPWAVVAVVPTAGLLPGGGPVAVVALGVAAAAAGWGLGLFLSARVTAITAALRDELHDAEQEGRILLSTIRRYPVLLEACQELGTAREVDQFATALCARARALMPQARLVAVHLGAGGRLTCRAASGADPSSREPGDEERYVATEARTLTRREGDALRILEPLRGDRRAEGSDHLPLRGVLEVVITVTDIGERLALEQLQALARLGGLGLSAVDLVGQARSLALHDDLTGLFGQHEFLRRLEELAAQARRHGQALGLVMCDMDHLKRFNDTHGHPAGDVALRGVATALRTTIGAVAGGLACRYGGEEFALVLPSTDLVAVRALAERIRLAVAAVEAPSRLSVSIGVTVLREDETARSALARADAACYRAKSGGRNRVAEAEELGQAEPDSGILPRVLGPGPRS